MDIALSPFVEIVVINSSDGEALIGVLSWRLGLFNILQYELAQLENKGFDVAHDTILAICSNLLNHVLLCVGITTEEVGDSAKQDGVRKLDVIPDVLFEQFSHELAHLA